MLNVCNQTSMYSYYFGIYTIQCMYTCFKIEIDMCSHTYGTVYMLHICIHTFSVNTYILIFILDHNSKGGN